MAGLDLNALLQSAGGGGGSPSAGPGSPGAGPDQAGPGSPPASITVGGGGDQGGGQGTPGQPDSPEAEKYLNDAINALKGFFEAEKDDKDKATAAKVIAQLQSILGNRQGDAEAALGITPQLRHVARQARRGR